MKGKGRLTAGILLRITGLLLIAAALILAGYNIRSEMQAVQTSATMQAFLTEKIDDAQLQLEKQQEAAAQEATQVIPDYLLDPDMEMPTVELDGHSYIGLLEIPALELSLPISSQWSYPELRKTPCRYTGSAYLDNLVIAAHNYQSHFGRLDELNVGDAVTFVDVDGNVFCYEVVVIEVLAPTQVGEMTDGTYDLTLFTCTYGGQSRVTVRCDRLV